MNENFRRDAEPLLSAFDQVANSNSHLLTATGLEGSLKERFASFVKSEAFEAALCESDRLRDWHNFHTINADGTWEPRPGHFYNGTPLEFQKALSGEELQHLLADLLKTGPCWYARRYPEEEVDSMVEGFAHAFLEKDTQVLPLKPTFLFGTNHFGENPPLTEEQVPYFDGMGCDYCWTWLRDDELFVLLLNGSD